MRELRIEKADWLPELVWGIFFKETSDSKNPRVYGQVTAVADGAEMKTQAGVWAETEMQADVGQAGLNMTQVLVRHCSTGSRSGIYEVAAERARKNPCLKECVQIRLCHSK